MNALERVTTVLGGGVPDRVPVLPVLLLQGAAELDLSLPDYFSRGAHWAEGQLRLWERYGHDAVFGIPHVVQDITAFGAPLIYFENGSPSAGGMAVPSYDDWFELDAPDPHESPELRETLDAISILKAEVGGEVPVIGACIAPFSLPSMLMGTECWMRLLFLEPPNVRAEVMPRILQVTTEFCVRWVEAQRAAGADALVLADGMASAAVITREQFIELALPVIRNTVPQLDLPVIHEGVGDLYPMVDLLVGTGVAGAILTCEDDLAAAKDELGDDLVLIGNLNNIDMRNWSPDEMTDRATLALERGASGGGFMLSAQGPEIPLGVDSDVIHAMVAAGHGWRY